MIRADASATIGTGHVMRCLALAQRWQAAGGEAVFAMAETTDAMDRRLGNQGARVLRFAALRGSRDDAKTTIKLLGETKARWMVLDGYVFDDDYLAAIEETGVGSMVVDDTGGTGAFNCDLLLNQNLHAREDQYPHRGANTRMLLGPRFALLRDEFVAYRDWSRDIPERAKTILVTMGGSDPENYTPRVITELQKSGIGDVKIQVVLGGSGERRFRELSEAGRLRVSVIRESTNMADLMASADLAISASGSTCWEMCLLGLPAILFPVAKNQEPIASALAVEGAAIDAGRVEENIRALAETVSALVGDADRRHAMSRAARSLVDGWGRERVLEAMGAGDRVCA